MYFGVKFYQVVRGQILKPPPTVRFNTKPPKPISKSQQKAKQIITNTSTQEPDTSQIPDDLIDPITFDLMRDPVRLVETNDVYDRESLQAWFARGHRTCPRTRNPLTSTNYVPDPAIKQRCQQYAESNHVGTGTLPAFVTSNEIHVFVRGLSGKNHAIQISPDDSVQTLKAKVSDQIGLQPREFNISYNGRQLTSGSLRSNSITDEANLIMTVNFQGGVLAMKEVIHLSQFA
eukprot:TRINITY_DN4913_c0_g2_i1.p1 TRINITY_DN4913_c0_g2~~TRINITY_DN4913_c0_g2_i1.p1  ORF type:complete len:232 (-),score=7.69 TRINITY_DN4913_c0_g2_i1:242-937(-)